jgi:predicted AAA+ superfamily ATPase
MLYQYLAYLEGAYLVFTLPIADRSIRKQAMNPQKVHMVDRALGYPFVVAWRLQRCRRMRAKLRLVLA